MSFINARSIADHNKLVHGISSLCSPSDDLDSDEEIEDKFKDFKTSMPAGAKTLVFNLTSPCPGCRKSLPIHGKGRKSPKYYDHVVKKCSAYRKYGKLLF